MIRKNNKRLLYTYVYIWLSQSGFSRSFSGSLSLLHFFIYSDDTSGKNFRFLSYTSFQTFLLLGSFRECFYFVWLYFFLFSFFIEMKYFVLLYLYFTLFLHNPTIVWGERIVEFLSPHIFFFFLSLSLLVFVFVSLTIMVMTVLIKKFAFLFLHMPIFPCLIFSPVLFHLILSFSLC